MSASVIAVIAVVAMVVIAGYLVAAMLFSIRKERRSANLRRTWANFGLSLVLCLLFLGSWTAQAFAQWDQYREEQRQHGQEVQIDGFINHFSQSTLENWQSEFLQLFSFVVLAALFIHHGSSESKDSDDRMEAKIDQVRQRLDELSSKR